jgi:hypothetical protein
MHELRQTSTNLRLLLYRPLAPLQLSFCHTASMPLHMWLKRLARIVIRYARQLTFIHAYYTFLVARRQHGTRRVPLRISVIRKPTVPMFELTSTMPTLAPPFPNSATISPAHSSRFSAISSSGGCRRHILTVPSRAPVAIR